MHLWKRDSLGVISLNIGFLSHVSSSEKLYFQIVCSFSYWVVFIIDWKDFSNHIKHSLLYKYMLYSKFLPTCDLFLFFIFIIGCTEVL